MWKNKSSVDLGVFVLLALIFMLLIHNFCLIIIIVIISGDNVNE